MQTSYAKMFVTLFKHQKKYKQAKDPKLGKW